MLLPRYLRKSMIYQKILVDEVFPHRVTERNFACKSRHKRDIYRYNYNQTGLCCQFVFSS